MNSNSKLPISGARVAYGHTDRTLATTDPTGKFQIETLYGWHGAYMIGPISYSLLPFWDMGTPAPSIRISAAGYHTKEFDQYVTNRIPHSDKIQEYYLSPK